MPFMLIEDALDCVKINKSNPLKQLAACVVRQSTLFAAPNTIDEKKILCHFVSVEFYHWLQPDQANWMTVEMFFNQCQV